MKTTQLWLWMLLAFTIGNAQTISLTSATPTSNTNDASTSVRIGTLAGNGTLSTGGSNTFVGHQAGKVNTSGLANTFVGKDAGKANINGDANLFLGANSGGANTSGDYNIFLGRNAGLNHTSGFGNILIGDASGDALGSGNSNTIIGRGAGAYIEGSGNIVIGTDAGPASSTSNQLFIDNEETDTPLIWGDLSSNLLKFNGKVGIGGVTTFPATAGGVNVSTYKLFVKGGILTEEVRVSPGTGWADYVFAKSYQLPTLQEVEKHIAEKGHLINVPSGKQIEQDGIAIGEMAKIQQEKIEELTLYIIDQNKINEKQALLIEQLTQRLEKLEQR